MPELFNILFGCVTGFLSLFCIVIYIIIQMIILRDRKLMKLSSYKIILCYGFVDITQLFVYVYCAFFAISGTTINRWAEKLSGFQLSLCWYNIGSLTVLLAANRLSLLCFAARAEEIFSETRTWCIIFTFVSVPSIFSFIWLTPIATYGFNATLIMWEYESPDFMPAFDRINTLTCSALSGLCYMLIVADVIRRAATMATTNHRREIFITLQVMLNGGYTLAVSIYFMFLRPYYVPYNVFYNATDVVLCLIWNGKSPVMHLIFNNYRIQKIESSIGN
uniref:7TM GPCR serpentine receptor class x (Srx) domain-containing protein n=1 Tax=Parascaris univalens TaxID=6257 RepID=A0A915BC68_PARUN